VPQPAGTLAESDLPPANAQGSNAFDANFDPSIFRVTPWNGTDAPPLPPQTVPSPSGTPQAQPSADDEGTPITEAFTGTTIIEEEKDTPVVQPTIAPTTAVAPGEKVVADQPRGKSGQLWTGCTKFKSYNARTQTYRGLDGLLHACKAN
jgi:hypothetical protein